MKIFYKECKKNSFFHCFYDTPVHFFPWKWIIKQEKHVDTMPLLMSKNNNKGTLVYWQALLSIYWQMICRIDAFFSSSLKQFPRKLNFLSCGTPTNILFIFWRQCALCAQLFKFRRNRRAYQRLRDSIIKSSDFKNKRLRTYRISFSSVQEISLTSKNWRPLW